ncbi:hypothetical protein Mal48_45390 [Thalassoglobus polymorphus]|uniref:Uncharacterized protein n=1 Tax=Thalassoglobus polymorphus TaxID=2527994 RepID=A0A517QUI2_9PLAN|nr:hypothetical protein Mal48_45390 [Thalassoglobus polymorphus]
MESKRMNHSRTNAMKSGAMKPGAAIPVALELGDRTEFCGTGACGAYLCDTGFSDNCCICL